MPAEVDEPWLDRRYYGGDLPAAAERCLHLAAAVYADAPAAERHLAAAAALAPGHRLVDLAHYKFHFYKADLEPALVYGRRMLAHALAGLGVNDPDWRGVTPATADFRSLDAAPRFFLFALTAVGYLLLRLGRREEGREALEKVASLDPDDRMGARRLIAVADRHESGEEEP
ncbi:hypothetical protein [Azospirillum halopraeferens]|uniref:hypothetical protein n=1 Tax=Azospirillum halopraeferens TaxID=34010 RepID=UPI00040A3C05|nr:hypothetical protein [Azospirillum halopraeferens]